MGDTYNSTIKLSSSDGWIYVVVNQYYSFFFNVYTREFLTFVAKNSKKMLKCSSSGLAKYNYSFNGYDSVLSLKNYCVNVIGKSDDLTLNLCKQLYSSGFVESQIDVGSIIVDYSKQILDFLKASQHRSIGDLFSYSDLVSTLENWLTCVRHSVVYNMLNIIFGNENWKVSSFSSLRISGSNGITHPHTDYPYGGENSDKLNLDVSNFSNIDHDIVEESDYSSNSIAQSEGWTNRFANVKSVFPLGVQLIYPLTDFDENTGGPIVVPRSHSYNFSFDRCYPTLNITASGCGGFLMWHSGLVHASYPGKSDQPRYSLMLNIVPNCVKSKDNHDYIQPSVKDKLNMLGWRFESDTIE